MCASSTSGCAFVYLYFKLRISGSKYKSSGDITGSTVLFKVLYHKIKFFFLFFVFIF